MNYFTKVLGFVAKYFVFLAGVGFIFFIGMLYAFIRPEGLAINLGFLVILLGWVLFLIKYFWDILEKDKQSENL